MAPSSSLSPPLLEARQDDSQEEEEEAADMATPSSPSSQRRREGTAQSLVHGRPKELLQSWAEMMLCCGADWGCLLRLWRRVVLRKWLNVGAGSGDSDFSADEGDTTDGEYDGREEKCGWERKLYDEEMRLRGLGAGTIGNQMETVPDRLRRRKSDTLRAQCTDFRELRICVGTWNVGGRFPPGDLDIQEWLGLEEPADIYVLGFQEIVPLNVGNIICSEDNRPVAVWEHIIRETLNRSCPNKSKYKCHSDPPSMSKLIPSDCHVMNHQLLIEPDNDNGSDEELHPLIEQDTIITDSAYTNKSFKISRSASNGGVRKDKDFSSWPPTRKVDLSGNLSHLVQDSESFTSMETPTTSVSFKSIPENTNSFVENTLAHDATEKKMPYFVRIISKQMVGIFLSIWVRRGLRKHIRNLRVSTVGVGAMGYIGNKGSISVSMSIYHTPFCFVCCHLTSGEKDEYLSKRNADVEEILQRTVFNPAPILNNVPKGIHDHERIIWLGDLNYRINLSYEKTHELISKQNWDGLLENDQLKIELRKGHTFDGWIEGFISFPPTYKYEFNSDKYASDEPKYARRTPAWCDRILSYGKCIRLCSYKRGELTLSDHRPVTAVYTAEIEVFCHGKLQKAVTFTDAEVDDHLLLEEESTS